VLNAANEVAVEAFLKNEITFMGIGEAVIKTVEKLSVCSSYKTLDELISADRAAREYVKTIL
jgi:1-deoxy-D-xylulose-5-phosphate reductoisomerase